MCPPQLPERWAGAISLGWTSDGKRIRRKVTGHTKAEVRYKLKKIQAEADAGLRTSANYTLASAVEDWADEALDGLADKTVRSHVDLLRPVTMLIGKIPLRDLTAHDVRRALNKLAEERSTRTMASTHNVLVRAIRHAEANDYVGRNVASFVKPTQGKTGRPSRAMTAAEAAALLAAAKDDPRLGAYVILSLTTGIRTEEARALRWDHVDLDGNPEARLPVPPHIAVWRSVRLHGDTKTEKSRRTLALPQNAVMALREHRKRQAKARLAAGPLWQDTGLMFTTSVGTPLDASHVPAGLPGPVPEGGHRGRVGAAGTAAHVRLYQFRVGRGCKRDRPAGRALQRPDDRDHLPARAPPDHHHRHRRDGPDLHLVPALSGYRRR
jgi:integrase